MKNNKNVNNNKNTKKQYTQKEKKPTMEIITFEKEFDDFGKGIKEMCEAHPYIRSIFEDAYYDTEDNPVPVENLNIDEVADLMFKEFDSNFPLINSNTERYSINMSANRCMLKTDKFIAFGYKFKYNNTGEVYDIVMTVTLFGKKKDNAGAFDKLEEMGWKQK